MFYQDPEVEKALNEKKGKIIINLFLIPLFLVGIYYGVRWMVLDMLTTAYYLDTSDLTPVSNGFNEGGDPIGGLTSVMNIRTVRPVSDAAWTISIVISALQLALGFALAHSRGWINGRRDTRLLDAIRGFRSKKLVWSDVNGFHAAATLGWLAVWMTDNVTDVGWKTTGITGATITNAQLFVLSVYLTSYFFIEASITVVMELVIALIVAQWRHLQDFFPGMSSKWKGGGSQTKQPHNNKKRPQPAQPTNQPPPRHRQPQNGPVERFAQESEIGIPGFHTEYIPLGDEAARPLREERGRVRQRPPQHRDNTRGGTH